MLPPLLQEYFFGFNLAEPVVDRLVQQIKQTRGLVMGAANRQAHRRCSSASS